ncbi:MAG: sodium:solute symporter family protein, partial [Oscillospiraceae bacterium]
MDSRLIQIWAVIALYVGAMVWVGVKSAKKTKTLTDFVVGSRKAGPWMSAFAYGTTYFSAVLFIGYAGRSGWDFGLWAILIGVSNAALGAYLAWKLLAAKTRDVTRRLKIKTMPQLFEARYQSRNMKIFAAIIIFIFMIPYSASVYSGLSYLCEIVLGINYMWAMAAIACIAAVYLVAGGYIASLSADLIQGIV